MVAFQMPLTRARWFYQNPDAVRHVDVEVDRSALERLNGQVIDTAFPYAIFTANRIAIERAARNVIDREGPHFVEPVRVTANDF
jgi:hypothetical protein